MTTIVAIHKNGKICVGADSLSVYGSRKELGSKLVINTHKLFCFNDGILATAGHASWNLILRNYFKTHLLRDIPNSDSLLETLFKMHKNLKEKYFLTQKTIGTDLFESSEYNFLLVTKHGIFDVEWDRTIRQYSTFSALGSGEQYALGAIKACYSYIEDPIEIAEIALKAAAKFDNKTELPPIIYHLSFH